MPDLNLEKIVKSSEAVLHSERYAYLQAREPAGSDHFMITHDSDEWTIITKEKNLPATSHDNSVKLFRMIEIRVSQPFIAKGFLAYVTKTLSHEGINVLVV